MPLLDPVLKAKLQKVHDLIKDSRPPADNIPEVVELRRAMNEEVNVLQQSLMKKLERVIEVSQSSRPELQRVPNLTDALTLAHQETKGGPGDNPGVTD